MLYIGYFLMLMLASLEDKKTHFIRPCWPTAIGILGFLHCITKENRWVTLALTCVCFLLFFFLYHLVRIAEKRQWIRWQFGGADVRLIPGMMLMQGWEKALTGIFLGLLAAAGYYLVIVRKKTEIPLVPWMAAGCFMIEVLWVILDR